MGKTCPLFGARRDQSLFLAVLSLPIFGRFLYRKNPLGKKPFSCWEKSLESLLVLYRSSGDFYGFSWSLFSAGRLLFSTFLREISAPLVRKFSVPSVLSLVFVGAGVLFSRCIFRMRTFLGKNPLSGKNPWLAGTL